MLLSEFDTETRSKFRCPIDWSNSEKVTKLVAGVRNQFGGTRRRDTASARAYSFERELAPTMQSLPKMPCHIRTRDLKSEINQAKPVQDAPLGR